MPEVKCRAGHSGDHGDQTQAPRSLPPHTSHSCILSLQCVMRVSNES